MFVKRLYFEQLSRFTHLLDFVFYYISRKSRNFIMSIMKVLTFREICVKTLIINTYYIT